MSDGKPMDAPREPVGSQPAGQPAAPRTGADWHALVWWGAGLALLALVALFCRFLLAPWLQVRAAITTGDPYEAIADLGGPDKAIPKLVLYARLPGWLPDRLTPGKHEAVQFLGKCGEKAVPGLLALLRARDPETRYWAAGALGSTGDARAVEPLVAALKDAGPEVRASAAQALGKINDPRAVEPLIAALKDVDADVRCRAAWALGLVKDPRAVEPLFVALKDTDRDVRFSAARALGEIGDARAVESLRTLLRDESSDVRSAAREALGKLAAPAQEPAPAPRK